MAMIYNKHNIYNTYMCLENRLFDMLIMLCCYNYLYRLQLYNVNR